MKRRLKQRPWVLCLGLVCGLFMLFMLLTPVASFEDPFSTVLYDHHGALLGATIASDGQWRFPTRVSVPQKFRVALETFEDKRFGAHPGVDVLALGRALWSNAAAGKVVSGGSTLTMQVVRMARKGKPRTYYQKLIEVLWALRLETVYSKEHILEMHAANAPFGGNVVGLEAAAWRYFRQSPDNLSWAECATLAVLPNSPGLIHPGRNRDRLKAKRDALLGELQDRGAISELTLELAKVEPLPPRPFPMPQTAPHLLARAPRGEAFHSTVDGELQKLVTGLVKRHHRRLEHNGIQNAAALVLDTHTGHALVYVGNIHDFAHDNPHHNFVDIIHARRSTGSLLKPFLFAGSLQSGELLPNQLLKDVPTRFGGFAPENFNHTYDGAVPASQALTRSLNVPAVRLLRSFGVARFKKLLRGVGMTTLHRSADDYGLTLILGGSEGTLWELTGAYASLGRSLQKPYVNDPARGAFFPPGLRGDGERGGVSPLQPGAAYQTLQTLLEVRRPGADGQWRSYQGGSQIAWKTGTSFGHRDAWAIGVTPEYTVGVWVGNADGEGRPGLTGSKAAAPLLFDIFDTLRPTQWFDPPWHDLTTVRVCSHSGLRAGPACEHTRIQTTPRHTTPSAPCTYCQTIHCDKDCSARAHSGCEALSNLQQTQRFVLPPQMEWFYRKHQRSYRGLPPWRKDCVSSSGAPLGNPLSVLSPANNSQILIPRELDGAQHGFVVKAAHHQSDATLFWHLDKTFLGTTEEDHQMTMNASPGEHRLTLVDAQGNITTLHFEVMENPEVSGRYVAEGF